MQTLFVLHEDMVFLQLCKFSKQSASLEEIGARRRWQRVPRTHTYAPKCKSRTRMMLAISVPNMAVRGDRIPKGYSIAMMATML